MKGSGQRSRRACLPFIVLASLVYPMLGTAGEDLSLSLKNQYQGKVLTLRHFFKGSSLAFSRDGSLTGPAEVGPWTTDGEIQVLKIDWKDQEVKIHARRILLAFDENKKSLRDFLEVVREWKPLKRGEIEQVLLANEVHIDIAVPATSPPYSELEAAINSVFLSESEFLVDFIPEFWSDYFKRGSNPLTTVRYSDEPVYRVTMGGMTAPRVIQTENPKPSAEALRAKYHPIVMLSVVVDSKGSAREIGILTPAGMGLDEKAIEAVGKWKFQAATKNGKPVATIIAVEVDFN